MNRITIHTGDENLCGAFHYLECPACSKQFDIPRGNYIYSATMDARILVCAAHEQLTVENEIHIQDSLQKALKSPRGAVQKDGVYIKIDECLKRMKNAGVC